jgi:membrane-associated PAP2 superfamily phosphatase
MEMGLRIQLVAIVVAGGLFFLVFELVRRKRLMERYALLWLFSTVVLLAVLVGLLRTRPAIEAGEGAAVQAEHGL